MTFDINTSVLLQTVIACKLNNQTEDAKTILSLVSKHCHILKFLDEVAYLQSEIKDYTGCVESLKKCLAMAQQPQEMYAVRANLAKMLNHLNDPVGSLVYSNANLMVSNGQDHNTLMEIAFSHYLNGDYAQSEKVMREIDAAEGVPDVIKNRVKYNLGTYDLEKGLFKQGLQGFIDVGHKIEIWKTSINGQMPMWDGMAQPGVNLYIHGEGGIGDELINFRFVENIKRLGMNPIWITNHMGLVPVFERHGVKVQTTINNTDNGVQCMAMYLPILLDLDKDQLWTGPYLKPSQHHLDKWKELLPGGKKLAVKWTGNPAYEQDLHRSLPYWFVKDLDWGCNKINLQLEDGLQTPDMVSVKDNIESVEDTLAILSLVDMTLTSCTSVVHMAGALGVDCVVCPPIASYYVWLGRNDDRSDWYGDNLKVYRQTKHRDWSDVFQKVKNGF